MPLHIVQGRYTANPTIVCDYCGEVITSAADGNYQWRQTAEGEGANVVFTHKKCCHPFEHHTGGQWNAISLSWLLGFLAKNLDVDVKRTQAEIRKFNC